MPNEFDPNPYRRPTASLWRVQLEGVMEDQDLIDQAAGDELYLGFLQAEKIHGIRYLIDPDNEQTKNDFLDAFKTRAAYEAAKYGGEADSETRP